MSRSRSACALLLVSAAVLALPFVSAAEAVVGVTPGVEAGTDHAQWRVAWTNAQNGGVVISQWSQHPQTDGARSPEDATYRLVVRPTVAGFAVRIRLTNSSTEPLRVDAASVAERLGTAGAGARPGRIVSLTFGGRVTVQVPPGESRRSDPVALPTRALQDVLVSLYVPTSTPQAVHAQSYVTQYVTTAGAGDRTRDTDDKAFTTEQEPVPWLDAVEVLTDAPRSIVAIGDSITEGDQANPPFNDDAMMNRYERWPDVVARRIAVDRDLKRAGIVNQGVNGDSTTGVLARLQRDVLDLAGVTDVVVAVGTNDVSMGSPAKEIIDNLTEIADRLHQRRLRVMGATLVPRGRQGDVDKETVNKFIRASPVFDGVFDMERVLSRSGAPDSLRPSYDSGDGLHPSPTGYEALGDAFDLPFLTSATQACRSDCTGGFVLPHDPRLRYEGRWDVKPNSATTVNSGARIVIRFRGTKVAARFDLRGITDPPQIYAYVDGEKSDRMVVDAGVIRLTREELPAGIHTLVLVVKDVHESSNRWQPPLASALRFAGFELGKGTLLADPVAGAHLRFTFLGDSITQGVNLHCPDTSSECADGTLAYPWLVAKSFNTQLEQVGFGSQGVTTAGGGGVPKAQDALPFNFAGSPASRFDADVVVINQTTNDSRASDAEVRTGYLELLRATRTRYPRATIIALEPFGIGGALVRSGPAIQAAIADLGDTSVHYQPTRGWLGPADFQESLHPTAAGHRQAAFRLSGAITEITGLQPAAAPAAERPRAAPPAASQQPAATSTPGPASARSRTQLPATGGTSPTVGVLCLVMTMLLRRRIALGGDR